MTTGAYPALDVGLGMAILVSLVTLLFWEMRTYAKLPLPRRRIKLFGGRIQEENDYQGK
jgi:hypothetical protein